MVASEAMASARPVVASRQGGLRELVRHGATGVLVRRYRSVGAWTEALGRVAGSYRLARRMGLRGRGRVTKRWTWIRTARQTERHLARVRRRS